MISKWQVDVPSSGYRRWSVSWVIHHIHDDVIKWKHFPRFWPFVPGIHRSPVNSLHKGQWRGALMFSLICAWINGWVNNREAGNLGRHCAHYDVIVMSWLIALDRSSPSDHRLSIYNTQHALSRFINSSLPGQNGRNIADDISSSIFMNEKFCVLIKILLRFVAKGTIDNNRALV